jgi:hypothetical protein
LNKVQTKKVKKDKFSLEDFWDYNQFYQEKLAAGLIVAVKNPQYLQGMTRVNTPATEKRLQEIILIAQRQNLKLQVKKLTDSFLTKIDIYIHSKLSGHYLKDSRRNQENYNVKLTRSQINIHPKDLF